MRVSESLASTDRASASPPCEVSSTTAMEDMTNAPATVSTPTTRIVEGVIAETSEPVEIEEDDDDDDEDLGLCIVSEAGEEIDDREPRREVLPETSKLETEETVKEVEEDTTDMEE